MTEPKPTTYTIAAISTPPGRGGIGIVRLSGPEAASIAVQLSAGGDIGAEQFDGAPPPAEDSNFQNYPTGMEGHFIEFLAVGGILPPGQVLGLFPDLFVLGAEELFFAAPTGLIVRAISAAPQDI